VLARVVVWRLIGLVAGTLGLALAARLLGGGIPGLPSVGSSGTPEAAGPRAALTHPRALVRHPTSWLLDVLRTAWTSMPVAGIPLLRLVLTLALVGMLALLGARLWARRSRRYVRLRIAAYRIDRAGDEALVSMFESLHKRLLKRWWERLLRGQPSLALEVHVSHEPRATLFVGCPVGLEGAVEAALRGPYPNLRLVADDGLDAGGSHMLRLKKRRHFIQRLRPLDRLERRAPDIDRLLTVMAAAASTATVQLALTPAPAVFERWSRHLYRAHEQRSARRAPYAGAAARSQIESSELRAALDVQHRPLFFADLRVLAGDGLACGQIASELRARGAENQLVERGALVRHRVLRLYRRRLQRGEGNPLPNFRRGVLASTELPGLWQLPSVGYLTVPFDRDPVPLAPAPPAILRRADGLGCLRDALGPVSIHEALRRQNIAAPGTVDQGKSSFLVATMAEDLTRDRCAIVVLDPKGDAAAAAISLVPDGRTVTLLDFSHPTCGFNPLAVAAPADVIADYVVAALRNLFTDADIRASSDRFLRNAIIAVLAADRGSSLWDAARLLSVGREGYAFRARVGARVRGLPEFKEISDFFTSELAAQLADSRSTTTAKLDAPVNKLARLLNSPSIKRVLLNDSLTVDFDRVIAGREVLVVKGALGDMGAGNTSVLMQLLVGMLDAALARQQDRVPAGERMAVALKIDEAPLVVNRGFAETLALKRSAGLETVACWQTDSQWTDRDVREQLDALFAHRVYFATASVRDARAAASLMMAEFADMVRSGDDALSALGRPDVRLHLPAHHAIASWTTPAGRQPPFVAATIEMRVDQDRIERHAARQALRGGRYLADLRQPHWDREADRAATDPVPSAPPRGSSPSAGSAPTPVAGTRPAPAVDAGGPHPGSRARLAPESYRELVELDCAASVRWIAAATPSHPYKPDPLDLAILLLVARMGHVLTSQIHRRHNPGRSATTTQRRLKRLADAGWLGRFQFHRLDGGGVPMCCVITDAGLELLAQRGQLPTVDERLGPWVPPSRQGPDAVRQARRDVHAAAWALAVEAALAAERCRTQVRGAREAAVLAPSRRTANGSASLTLAELSLPGGRTAHDFLRTAADGRRVAVERFDSVRPAAAIELQHAEDTPGARLDLLVALDHERHQQRLRATLERYDHLICGWATRASRYRRRESSLPAAVFVCRDAARARACARQADLVLTACRAYAGDYPFDWEYHGRERIFFVAERDVHEGGLQAYRVPRLPPAVRVDAAGGEPAARAADPELGELPPTWLACAPS
jgi:hypothetical protein